MSFSCEDCGYANNEIQPGGQIADKGLRIRLEVKAADDLNRQVVKSDYTGLRIVELDFEVPPKSQKGGKSAVREVRLGLVYFVFVLQKLRRWKG